MGPKPITMSIHEFLSTPDGHRYKPLFTKMDASVTVLTLEDLLKLSPRILMGCFRRDQRLLMMSFLHSFANMDFRSHSPQQAEPQPTPVTLLIDQTYTDLKANSAKIDTSPEMVESVWCLKLVNTYGSIRYSSQHRPPSSGTISFNDTILIYLYRNILTRN